MIDQKIYPPHGAGKSHSGRGGEKGCNDIERFHIHLLKEEENMWP